MAPAQRRVSETRELAGLVSGKIVARLTNVIDGKWDFSPGGHGANRNNQPESIELALDTELAAGQN